MPQLGDTISSFLSFNNLLATPGLPSNLVSNKPLFANHNLILAHRKRPPTILETAIIEVAEWRMYL